MDDIAGVGPGVGGHRDVREGDSERVFYITAYRTINGGVGMRNHGFRIRRLFATDERKSGNREGGCQYMRKFHTISFSAKTLYESNGMMEQ